MKSYTVAAAPGKEGNHTNSDPQKVTIALHRNLRWLPKFLSRVYTHMLPLTHSNTNRGVTVKGLYRSNLGTNSVDLTLGRFSV